VTSAVTATVRGHWELFVDWCAATGQRALPATPETVAAYLKEMAAGPATLRRRLLAVDAAHRRVGYPPPSASPAFDALLRPARPARFAPELVAAALAVIPVGGWPAGVVGRRDAALVTVICTAGLTRRQAQGLYSSAVQVTDQPLGGWGSSATKGFPAVAAAEHPGTCPACAVTRWQRVTTATATVGWRAVRAHLADLGEITAGDETGHDCTRPVGGLGLTDDDGRSSRHTTLAADSRPVPLFCAIDRHGTPQTGYPLSTRSITAVVAARLAMAGSVERGEAATTGQDRPGAAGRWSSDDHARAIAARHAATDRLARLEADLDGADAYAEAILARLEADLAG